MLGLRRGAVQLVPYTPIWAALFQSERTRLQHALGAHALDIQHIGSTAVPGLAAKPILDLAIAVAAEAVVAACVPRLTALGYTYGGYRGSDQGHFFDQGHEQYLTHYLHMLSIGEPAWSNYLRFRDYLVAHPAVRDAYMQLKQDLAAQYSENRAAYTAAKAAFVQHILAAAAEPDALDSTDAPPLGSASQSGTSIHAEAKPCSYRTRLLLGQAQPVA